LTLPRSGARQEALRVLLLARRRAVDVRRVVLVQLRSVSVTAPEHLREEREILKHVRALVPDLLDEPGVGPIVAAQLIVTWSHRDRVRSEAAFARLAGVAPLPASSGHTIRHRLSRAGDRQLNRALHHSHPSSSPARHRDT
jgi:transposase